MANALSSLKDNDRAEKAYSESLNTALLWIRHLPVCAIWRLSI